MRDPLVQSLFETITLAGNPVTLLGLTGLACVAAWPFLRDRRSALAVQSAGALAFAMHFALLGAFTAAAASGLSLVQLLVAITSSDPHRRRSLDGLMLVALMLLTIMTWHGALSALVACASVISMRARSQRSIVRMKATFLVAAPFWLAHNLLAGAYFALAVDLVSVVGNLAGLIIATNRDQPRWTAIGSNVARFKAVMVGACSTLRLPVGGKPTQAAAAAS
ncbi:YgjV family protein [Sphingobium fuliginis]|jgi:hypothetical protein|uniref:YgjV family protein n=2 Tax=Sphingomonadaceae TaxID=41297 RepID=UPI0008356B09|nr:YgjV family protein [Sphingobium fuliginis]MDG5972984.1 hypothetical protein [Sphingomonas paucimobilis]